jgi:hypothetical protein
MIEKTNSLWKEVMLCVRSKVYLVNVKIQRKEPKKDEPFKETPLNKL